NGAGPLVGETARPLAAAAPDRFVRSIKRRMGSDYRVRADGKEYTPQEVSSFILRKVKGDAERYLGETIGQAVITVPAYFNDRQRQATKEAAALAGLEVMRIINEPTAAALAYGLQREDAHTILVWDLGGGTFDVSILELGEGIFEVRAVSGDSRLGGDDWDSLLLQHLMAEYGRASGTEFPNDAGARYRLRELAERAKRELSTVPVTRVRLPLGAGDARYLELEVSREQLEALTRDLLDRMVTPTHQALADAGLSPGELDRVILVGGMTRMPAVRDMARSLFGKEPYRYIDPDEVVALGAAIQAGMLLGTIEKAVLLDVLPLSLGVETQGCLMGEIIHRNTPLPANGSRIFTTASDYQTSMDVHVLQGERELADENVSLGRFQLDGIPRALRGVPKVEVAFDVDVDGIVQVSAEELLSGSEVKVVVVSTKSLDTQEIDRLAAEAERQATADRERREEIEARLEAQNVATAAEAALKERSDRIPEYQAALVNHAICELREALERGSAAGLRARSRSVRNLLMALASTRGAASK
ncbi:MAG: Hsp70 family protein, partial [Chloroflexota bacterium]|nr:Hsp70 family protein [Chloroflexota bacterium]